MPAPTPARPRPARLALWLIAPALAAGALALSARPHARGPSAPPASKPSPAAAAAAAPAAAPLRERCSFSPGERVSYEVRFDEQAELDASKLLGKAAGASGPKMDLSVSARLELVGLGAEGADSVVAARFEGATAVDRSSGSAGPLEGIDRPFLFRMNGRCGVEALARHRDAPVAVSRRQQGMLLAFEALLPEHGERTYEAEQRDATGVFRARYGHGAAGGVAVVERKIERYGALWSHDPRGGKAQGVVTSSKGTVEPGPGPWFEKFHEETSVSLRAGGASLGRTSVKKDARRVESGGRAFDGSAIDVRDYVWGDVLEQRGAEAAEPSAEDAAIASLSSEALVARYLAAVSAPGAKVGPTVRLLVSYLRAHPERSGDLLSAVASGTIPSDKASPVFAALGQAGGPLPEKALLGAAGDRRFGELDRSRAIVALSTIKGAGPTSVEALRALARGKGELVSSSAMMALGAMAGRRSQASPEAAEAARAAVKQALSSTDKASLKVALASAGNAGLAELLPDIERGLRHDDAGVRAQAALALRGLPPEATVASMASTLSSEKSAEVRRAMLEATFEQAERGALPEASLSTVSASLARETDTSAAAAQVKILGASLKAHPELKQALVARFRAEKDPGVMRLIGSYLGAEEL